MRVSSASLPTMYRVNQGMRAGNQDAGWPVAMETGVMAWAGFRAE